MRKTIVAMPSIAACAQHDDAATNSVDGNVMPNAGGAPDEAGFGNAGNVMVPGASMVENAVAVDAADPVANPR